MANRALVARLEQRDTGRLRVGRGASEIHVCVWDGEIVAATSGDDLRHMLRRMLLAGALQADRVQELLAVEETGAPVFGAIVSEVSDQIVENLLYDRFVENLTRYLGSGARPRFSHQPAIFADNFQLGHDAVALVQECADAWDDAMSVDLDMQVFPGSAPARNDLQQVVLARLGQGTTISRLLVQLPAEPFSARALIARMLRSRIVDTTFAQEADTQHTNGKAHPAIPGESGIAPVQDDPGETYVPDDHTPISVDKVLPTDTDDPATEPDSDIGAAVDPLGDTVVMSDAEDEPEIDPDDMDDPPTEEITLHALAGESNEEPVEEALDEPAVEPEEVETKGAGDLSSLEAWMNHGVDAEDDLDAFNDHDSVRGEEGAGNFTTEEHNLDRVEVVASLEAPEEEAAPTAKFGGPVLSDRDARTKVEVANTVLLTLSQALDVEEGAGRGQAALQILLEGSPNKFQSLFANLNATSDGQLPIAGILRNLNHRPPTEHRRLLNEGLLNLIERALSLSVEDLPDEAIDDVLENVAGYRQRLGL